MDIEFWKQLFVLVGEIEDKKLSDYVIVIILAIVMCMIISLIIKSINITSVEKIFMDSKQNRINSFYKLIAMMIVFTPFNYLLSRLKAFIAIEIILIIVTVVRIIIFKCQEKMAKKNENADTSKELNISNKNKVEDAVIFLIITVSPVTLYFFSIRLMSSIPEFNCAIMVGIIEVLIICLAIPQLVVSDSRCYFIMNNKKMFIYKKIDEDTFLCGDNTKIGKADKYISINYKELKRKEIFNIKYDELP